MVNKKIINTRKNFNIFIFKYCHPKALEVSEMYEHVRAKMMNLLQVRNPEVDL